MGLVPRQTTRQRIIRAASQMVVRGSDLPVDDVARKAGVSVQTIYAHFGSKRGLIFAVIDDLQRDIGFYEARAEVFASPHGEAALRKMVAATITLWDQAWPLVAFTLRARRADRELASHMADVDGYRRSDLSVICRRIDEEKRLRTPGASEAAADVAFALSTPTTFEDLVKVRGWSADRVAETLADIIVLSIVDPATKPVVDPAPSWSGLLVDPRSALGQSDR
jgi:AcrR family transcriptional regulator